MDLDQAATFLTASILTMLGIIVVVGGIVIVNNIIHKYWKSFGWKFFPAYWDQPSPRFANPDEIDKSTDPKLK